MASEINTNQTKRSQYKFMMGFAPLFAAQILGCSDLTVSQEEKMRTVSSSLTVKQNATGALSGKHFFVPDVNIAPMPAISSSGVIYNGKPLKTLQIPSDPGQPDVRSFRRKFGLLIPATNTSMEHELWSIIFKNPGVQGLEGIGLHTTNIITPRPQLRNEADLEAYKLQFLNGLNMAVDQSKLAQPQYLIMGMSLEHILHGIDKIRQVTAQVEAKSGLAWATWHDAAPAALNKFKARRIGLLTPFDKKGNENAIRMFKDLGFEVVASVGLACANALDIAHIPDSVKERAIRELLAVGENRLDAIVQSGTNMSLIHVTEKLESETGIPILGINAVTFWYALRENGINNRLVGAGRLFREF